LGPAGLCVGPSKDCPITNSSAANECRRTLQLAVCRNGTDGTPAAHILWRWSAPVPSRQGIGRLQLQGTDLCLQLINNDFRTFGVELDPKSCRSSFAESQLWLWEAAEPALGAEAPTESEL
ncbi:unnamed protein product, partial [Polarella glacialis]